MRAPRRNDSVQILDKTLTTHYTIHMNTKPITSRTLIVLNIIAYVAVLFVNFLSNALPLNGRTAEEISDALPSFFTPAGYTFSIWGLIYLALLGFVIFQALPAQRDASFQRKIGPLFVLSGAANITWLFAWHYGYYVLSIVIMAALLVTLIAIYLRLRVGLPGAAPDIRQKLFVHLPFSLYLGWITVATIANTAGVVGGHLGWNGFGVSGPVWSALMMFVAAAVAGLLLMRRSDPAYAGVLIWALFGIRAAYPDVALIATSALIAAGIIALLAVLAWYRRLRRPAAATGQMQAA